MAFYHFTSRFHLDAILRSGFLMPSESNVGSPHTEAGKFFPYGEDAGPRVVWLTDTPDPVMGHGLLAHTTGKDQVRITVDVKAIRWLDWAWTSVMDPQWREDLIHVGGGEDAAAHWYIVPAPIRGTRFTDIAVRTQLGSYNSIGVRA